MRIIETKVYKFDELSEKVKKTVLASLAEINIQDGWWNGTIEDAENIGLKIVCFELYESVPYAKGTFSVDALEVGANILRDHGKHCKTYKLAETFLENHAPIYSEYLDSESEHYESPDHERKLMELEEGFLTDLLDEYSNMLCKDKNYLYSDEAIIETIDDRNYEFTEDGKLWIN